jgi:hypothetical protein
MTSMSYRSRRDEDRIRGAERVLKQELTIEYDEDVAENDDLV